MTDTATPAAPVGVDRVRGRDHRLDGLRALAAVMVIITHAGDWTDSITSPHAIWIQQLNVGVDIFFVISAVLLYAPYVASHLDAAAHPHLATYALRRISRIYPAYWVALIIILPLSPIFGITGRWQWFSVPLLIHTYSLGGLSSSVGLRQSWTLVVEVSFYAFLPFYAWCIRALGRRMGALRAEVAGALALSVIGPVCLLISSNHYSIQLPFVFRILPPSLGIFAAGMLIVIAREAVARMPEVPAWWNRLGSSALAWLALAGFAYWLLCAKVGIPTVDIAHFTQREQFEQHLLQTAIAFCVVAPAVVVPRGRSLAFRVIGSPPLAFVGMVSYGIYLWHYAVIEWLVRRIGCNPAGLLACPPSVHWSFVKVALGAIPLSIAIGAASWYLVERPMIRLAHRYGGRLLPVKRVVTTIEAPAEPPGEIQVEPPPRAGARGFHVGLAFIAVVGLLFRIWYVVWERGRVKLNGDAVYYHFQANDIAHGLWFIEPNQYHWFGRITPSAGHPPVYILYLAAVSRFIGQSELTHRVASCFLGGLAIFIVGLIGREIADERVGLLAAAGVAVYAQLWINDEMLMSESAYVLVCALMVLWAIKFWKRPSTGHAALMGLGIGLAALTRAEAALLFPLLALPYALAKRHGDWRIRARFAVVAIGMGVLVMAPWIGFNLTRFKHPVFVSNGFGSVLMVSNCGQTYGHQFFGYWSFYCARDLGSVPGDESEKETVWRKRGLRYVDSHTGKVPEVMVARVARMWGTWTGSRIVQGIDFDAVIEGRGLWQSKLATDQYYLFFFPALWGLWILKQRKKPILPFVALAATITFTAATTFGITRYRAPIDAMLPLLAAVAFFTALDRWRARRAPEPAADPPPPTSPRIPEPVGA